MTVCFTKIILIFPCSCWLALENGAIWAFVAPALFVILVGKPTAAAVFLLPVCVSRRAELADAWHWARPVKQQRQRVQNSFVPPPIFVFYMGVY